MPENSQTPPKSCFSLSAQGTPQEEIPLEILTGIRKNKAAPMEHGKGIHLARGERGGWKGEDEDGGGSGMEPKIEAQIPTGIQSMALGKLSPPPLGAGKEIPAAALGVSTFPKITWPWGHFPGNPCPKSLLGHKEPSKEKSHKKGKGRWKRIFPT